MEFSRQARRRGVRTSSYGAGVLPSKRKSNEGQGRSRKRTRRHKDPLDSTVMVRDLDEATTIDHLKDFFQNYGDVSQVRVVPKQGYGLVTFDAREIAQGVIAAMGGKEGFRMGNTNRKVQVSWAVSGFLPEVDTGNWKSQKRVDPRRQRRHQGLPRRCKSRLFMSAVASAVASATAEAVIQGHGPRPSVEELPLPNRAVIAYDDWL